MTRIQKYRLLLTCLAMLAITLPMTTLMAAESEKVPRPKPEKSSLKAQIHLTYGGGGPKRSPVLIQGDAGMATLRVSGIRFNQEGKANVEIVPELLDEQGEPFRMLPKLMLATPLSLGGDSFVRVIHIPTGPEIPAGRYALRVSVADKVANEHAQCEMPVEVLPESTFGVLLLRLAHDPAGKIPAGPGFVVGQKGHICMLISGHQIADHKLHINGQVTLLDEEGNQIGSSASPFSIQQQVQPLADPTPWMRFPMQFNWETNRPGRFRIQLQLEDQLGGGKANYEIPFTVTGSDLWDEAD